nr:unnamed protein product [Digitaria exilis]
MAAPSSAWLEWAAEYTKAAQAECRPPPEWAARVSAAAGDGGDVPWSAGLAEVLARALLSGAGGGAPAAAAWKYAEAALAARLASPALLLALLSTRIIPHRFSRPMDYRLYLELLKRHGFNFHYQMKAANFRKIMDLIDAELSLSKIFGISTCQPGVFVVHFVLCILWQLVDVVLDDEGLLELTPENKAQWPTRPEDVSTFEETFTEQRTEKIEKLQKMNTATTMELIEHLLRDKVITRILSLARENMQSHWEAFTNRLHLLATNSSTLQNSAISSEPFQQLILGECNVYGETKHNMCKRFHPIVASNPLSSPNGRCLGASYSALWIPIDMYLEDCLDGSIAATNSIEILSGLVKALQSVNRSTWHDAFLALWVASLRLVQREREPIEGPVPHLDTRLCMLLSITTLAIADIIEEADSLCNETELSSHMKEKKSIGNLRNKLMLSLQILGDYESLLVPPPYVVPAANQAATKAAMFISGISNNGYMENVNGMNYSHKLDGSLAEVKKLFEVAINGSDDDNVSAATVLCGATLLRGWNFQLPAWEILEAVPFVVDAALTACSHGRLFPRELATGLKDLADFLPASLATIVSYFSAEVTRGVWKPASMNGSDWPSPSANLSMVEEHIKKIVATTGVDVPRLATGGSSLGTLPLPLAAFVSLTITYKLDKASERFLNLAGPALENLAASCPWPSMAIVAALWTQKVKRWSDFLVFSASRTVFHHNNEAVVQLLRSCFAATLGMSSTSVCSCGGVASLLGHGYCPGGFTPVAPGILYLRIFRCIKDCSILAEDILDLLMLSVKDIAETTVPKQRPDKLKKTKYGMRQGQVSLSTAMTQVKVAASLGATLVWLSGGPALVQSLIQEMLPSWFLTVQNLDQGGSSGGMVYKLGGHALAYLAVYSGMFAWGIDSTPVSRRRERVTRSHLQFLASALDGKISLGCDPSLWRAYVSGVLGLVVECTPCWVQEVDLKVLKRLSSGLRQWGEEGLAVALLRRAGPEAMGAAAELILGREW